MKKKTAQTSAPRAIMKDLPLEQICIEDSIQSRKTINGDTVNEYADLMQNGKAFPPIVICQEGDKYWLADGFHRFQAAFNNKCKTIKAKVRPGTRQNALEIACGANADHGLRRTAADKQRAVELLLGIPAWCDQSDKAVAKHCSVSHPFVAKVRKKIAKTTGNDTQSRRRGRDGRIINTAKIGQKQKKTESLPQASTQTGPASTSTEPESPPQKVLDLPHIAAESSPVLPVVVEQSPPHANESTVVSASNDLPADPSLALLPQVLSLVTALEGPAQEVIVETVLEEVKQHPTTEWRRMADTIKQLGTKLGTLAYQITLALPPLHIREALNRASINLRVQCERPINQFLDSGPDIERPNRRQEIDDAFLGKIAPAEHSAELQEVIRNVCTLLKITAPSEAEPLARK